MTFKMSPSRIGVATSAAVVITGFASGVAAQSLEKATTVLERERPELDPLGIRLGAFKLKPSISATVTSDDNIFRTETGTVSDIITAVKPSADLSSNWNNHLLGFNADATIGRYADRDREDYEDYNLGANGRIDITRNANVALNAGYSKLHEERGSPNDSAGRFPTEYSLTKAGATFNQKFNRVKLALDGKLSQYDYDNGITSSNTAINNKDRNRDEIESSLRLGYEITPSYEAFVKTTLNDRKYDRRTDDNGQIRDSNGYVVDGGIKLDLGGVMFGDVFAGYRSQSYDEPTFKDTTGVNYGGKITWNASQLTTAVFSIARSVDESTTSGVSGILTTSYNASVDHEFRRNVLIGAKVGYSKGEFRGTAREDENTKAGLYAKYMLSRYLYITGGYDYEQRDSTNAGADFTNNRFMLKLESQL